MSKHLPSIRCRSKYAIVDAETLLENAWIEIQAGRIIAVGEFRGQPVDWDLGRSVMLPALVNPHTHLEFSDLSSPFAPGSSFPEWIGRVLRWRQQNTEEIRSRAMANLASTSQPQDVETQSSLSGASPGQQAVTAAIESERCNVISRGLREAYLSGTAVVGDIITQPWSHPEAICLPEAVRSFESASSLSAEPKDAEMHATDCGGKRMQAIETHLDPSLTMRLIAFAEMIGLDQQRATQTRDWGCHLVQELARPTGDDVVAGQPNGTWINAGVSPHAPYSIHWSVIDAAIRQLPQEIPLAMHVAETLEERQWIESQSGPFAETFSKLGLPTPDYVPSILDCLHLLAGHQRGLVIHGNYLTDQEIDYIAKNRNLWVVYCPRTHQHFGHATYPLEKLSRSGVSVLLGTDSRASNPDINLWSEARLVHQRHPAWSPAQILRAITQDAADALGMREQFGMLRTGYRAAINVVPCPSEFSRLSASDTSGTSAIEDLVQALLLEELMPQPLALCLATADV